MVFSFKSSNWSRITHLLNWYYKVFTKWLGYFALGIRVRTEVQSQLHNIITTTTTAICTNVGMVDRRECGSNLDRAGCVARSCCWTQELRYKRCSESRPNTPRLKARDRAQKTAESQQRAVRRTEPRKVKAEIEDSVSGKWSSFHISLCWNFRPTTTISSQTHKTYTISFNPVLRDCKSVVQWI